MTLHQGDLDHMGCDGCGKKHPPGGMPLFFHGKCHLDAPSWVMYQDGVLHVACAQCGETVAEVAVATQ